MPSATRSLPHASQATSMPAQALGGTSLKGGGAGASTVTATSASRTASGAGQAGSGGLGVGGGGIQGHSQGRSQGHEFTATRSSSRSSGDGSSSSVAVVERNIDDVVLGDLMFKTWYPSYHVKEIVGKDVVDGGGPGGTIGAGSTRHHHSHGHGHGHGASGGGTMLDRLYVCNRCFKYSKELIAWKAHMRVCDKEVPGNKIYTHGKSTSEEGVWTVWEVDGEVEPLYCQNLSLFAKLFLDNKSVFFDVTGFNYFLLVHISPVTGAQQVVGFFSKEKMSWDQNNLACILIFPPWQRKNLGAILIGVSYEISRRERILGGPEKPISTLGRKSYRRYWQVEMARYLLDVKETDRKKDKGLVTIDEISNETWICHEDILMTLREMGIAQAASKGKEGIPCVKIDKEALRNWLQDTGTVIERAIDPEGFVEGYALPQESDEEMED